MVSQTPSDVTDFPSEQHKVSHAFNFCVYFLEYINHTCFDNCQHLLGKKETRSKHQPTA